MNERQLFWRTAVVYVIAAAMIMSLPAMIVNRIRMFIRYEQDCGAHLKAFYMAATPELAEPELQAAMDYADGLPDGNTAVVWPKQDESVTFWKQNIHATMDKLNGHDRSINSERDLQREVDLLQAQNDMLKVRRLTACAYDTTPDGISAYPHNVSLFWFMIASICALPLGIFIAVLNRDFYRDDKARIP